MASRFLIPRTSKALNHLFHSIPPTVCKNSSPTFQIRPSIPRFFTTESPSPALDPDTRVPATIITGFFGSGKTTLLNHILTAQHGKRIAVIKNDFAKEDVDTLLVADHSSVDEDIVMVNNDCICCTVRVGLVKMLETLFKKKRDKFDHIVIETTGLNKPYPVIDAFITNKPVAQHVKLDGVVTLVDCKHAMQHLNEVKPRWVLNETVEQVAYANRIILNKIDLVSKADLEAMTKKIMHINGMAQIKEAEFGVVDMDFVLGVGGYGIDRIESEVQVNENHDTSHPGYDRLAHHRSHFGHLYESAVSSVSIVSEGTLDMDKVNNWLVKLLGEKGKNLYRIKGVISMNESTGRYVLQGVHSRLEGCPAKPWGTDEKKINKLVFIGRNLDEVALRKAFKGCLV